LVAQSWPQGQPVSHHAVMHERLGQLIDILDLEEIENNVFRGHHRPGTQGRLFGGQIMAQALIAAGRTVTADRLAHSLHGYFLRPGDPAIPVLFSVDPIRDGRSFTTRRVVAIQHGRAIFEMSVSFQTEEDGFTHQRPMPDTRPPTRIPKAFEEFTFISLMDDFKRISRPEPQPPYKRIWFKTNGEIETDDPLLHAALITYQSDNDLLSTSRLPHQGTFEKSRMQRASLDHAMWFHHRARADRWTLYDLDSPSTSAARGYNRGFLYAEDGTLIGTAIQESLMRMR
jgi:acyl-CoA thioesterase-2